MLVYDNYHFTLFYGTVQGILMKRILMGLLLLSSSTLFAIEYFPPPFTAEYQLYAKGIPVGKGTRSLMALPEGKWQFETIGETTGVVSLFQDIRIEERSIFTQANGIIRPLKYTYFQTGNKARSNELVFDWSQKVATNTFKDETKTISLKEGTLDRLLYQVVLMQELEQGKRKLQYPVADKGKITVYTPTFLGKERIETGLGKLETLKYERLSSNKERRTTLWCAPTLHYLPVRVEHVEEEDGDVFSLVLQSVTGLN